MKEGKLPTRIPWFSVLLNSVLFEKVLCYLIGTQNEGKVAFGIPAMTSCRVRNSAHVFECFVPILLKRMFSAGDLYLGGGLAKDLCTEDILHPWRCKEHGMYAVSSSSPPLHILNVSFSMKWLELKVEMSMISSTQLLHSFQMFFCCWLYLRSQHYNYK